MICRPVEILFNFVDETNAVIRQTSHIAGKLRIATNSVSRFPPTGSHSYTAHFSRRNTDGRCLIVERFGRLIDNAPNALDMIFCGAADSGADCRRVRRCRCDAVEGLACSPVNLIRTLSKHRRHDFTATL